MPTPKNAIGECCRQQLSTFADAIETNRADSGLTVLSYQSLLYPNRHIWLDTDLGGQMVLDLEDWNDTTKWDNGVAHFTATSLEILITIAKAWLEGANLDDCNQMGGEELHLE